MQLMQNLKRIASADQMVRRTALLDILREMDCPFVHHREKVDDGRPENIVVSFEGEMPRLVVGAHYDSVPGSTGANDNGASVCIVLEMVRSCLQTHPHRAIDFCFFDLEEVPTSGAKAYLNRVAHDQIWAMINFDVCGLGDTLLLGPKKHVDQGPLQQPMMKTIDSGKHVIEIAEKMPPGDDRAFEQVGIPNVSVGILPKQEVGLVQALGQANPEVRVVKPPILETMHNGPRDSIAFIEEAAMQKVLSWALDVVGDV